MTRSAQPPKILCPFFDSTVKGVSVRASRPRQRRRIFRERHAAFQEKVREIWDPVGIEEAAALREAQREAQAQDDPSPKEDASETLGGTSSHPLNGSEREGDVQALEFDVVLRLVSSLARTEPGRRAIEQLTPARQESSVARLLEETSEAWAFRLRHGKLPLAGIVEISPILAALQSAGGAASPQEFRPILAVVRASEAVRRALAKADSPHLLARRDRLPQFDSLLDRARKLFAQDGSVRDDASPELLTLRTRLRRRRTEISRSLEKLLGERRDFLGDTVVVLRNDRYCLPVVASARARVPGIVHDRSGSGQTVFVEPIEVIESNNELALLASEERHEVERLLTGFGKEVLAVSSLLEEAVEQIAQLDALEAKVEFGELAEGRIPESSGDGGWALAAARHPLLDERLAPLRRRVLAESRQPRAVVPLDLELSPQKRMLVVSGPNAGGKTVVLKTAGLFSLLAQTGLPLPVGPGTRVPVFRSIRTEIGDAQAILSDRSTFSSSMETLASILEEAAPGTLALVDEIGGSTDPVEGSAIAVAFLEEYLGRGGRVVVTTHLSAVKSFAAGREDSLCAAMEFDERSGRPNYRLHPGLSGRSRALSVAREQGLPETVLKRAQAILGDAWKRQERRESEAEAALERLRAAEHELAAERERARREAERLEQERRTLALERTRMLEEGLAGFERARRELLHRVEEELSAIRLDASRRAEASADRLIKEVEEATQEPVVHDARQEALGKARGLVTGGHARIRGGKTTGIVVSLDEEAAWLEVAGKKLRVPRSELEPAGEAGTPGRIRSATVVPERADADSATAREVNVIGQHLEEAISEVEKRLDEALLAGAARLRVIHGHGTGRLREGLREHLRQHPAVASLRAADARQGGNGATIVELK